MNVHMCKNNIASGEEINIAKSVKKDLFVAKIWESCLPRTSGILKFFLNKMLTKLMNNYISK